jgi:hypothetical protein
MRKIDLVFLLIGITLTQYSFGQNKMTINNVLAANSRNMGPIIENEQVKGYYMFFQSDKIDKNTNEYTLRMLDENCNLLKDAKFTDSKKVYLLESSFNREAIMFLFYNDDDNSLTYRLFGLDGKQTLTYSKTLDKKSESYFKEAYGLNTKDESENKSVYDIPAKGFITVTPLREDKKYTYDISYYSSAKRKTWNFNPVETGKFQAASYLGANDSVAVFEVLSKEGMMSKEVESTLLGISLETGKKVFEKRTQDGKYKLYPMNISALRENKNEFLLIGPYYEGTDKINNDKTEGLGVWQMNNQGKLVTSKYISWSRDLVKFAKVDQKGKLADVGYIYFHKFLQTENGKFFAIGEGYKKVADGVGIALSILSRSAQGVTKMQVTDLVMLQLSDKFELENARIIDKKTSSYSLGAGYDFASPHALANALKMYGYFDYTFTQRTAEKASFVTGYTDYEKSKEYKGMNFHAISYHDGSFSEDKIPLKSEASSSQVFPAKTGFVLLWEYFKKKKIMEVRLEKIN